MSHFGARHFQARHFDARHFHVVSGAVVVPAVAVQPTGGWEIASETAAQRARRVQAERERMGIIPVQEPPAKVAARTGLAPPAPIEAPRETTPEPPDQAAMDAAQEIMTEAEKRRLKRQLAEDDAIAVLLLLAA